MSNQDTSAVDLAREWARLMINRESRGPGDRTNAMRRIAKRNGLSFNLLWSLIYRPPSDMFCGVFDKLEKAYENELRRTADLLEHERKTIDPKTAVGKTLVGLSDRLAGSQNETLNQRRKPSNDH